MNERSCSSIMVDKLATPCLQQPAAQDCWKKNCNPRRANLIILLYKTCDARYVYFMNDEMEKIATNIRKGVLEYCVLALLSHREMYGMELANDLVQRKLTASEGSLYPLLTRMRNAGSVETSWRTPAAGRARRYYTITKQGRRQLENFAEVWASIFPHVNNLLKEES